MLKRVLIAVGACTLIAGPAVSDEIVVPKKSERVVYYSQGPAAAIKICNRSEKQSGLSVLLGDSKDVELPVENEACMIVVSEVVALEGDPWVSTLVEVEFLSLLK